jgi:L-aspartate oxidase
MTLPPLADNFDAIVVGAGAAGLYSALCLPSHLRVALIGKDSLPLSASDWAQGGIAAVVDPQDSIDLHIADTIEAGAGLCDRAAVEYLVTRAPACIAALVDLGVGFDREGEKLALTLEAAHSRPRVLHAADATGRALVATLAERVVNRSNISVFTPAFAIDLWMVDGRCQGISVFYDGKIQWVRAAAVILATGGGGQVFAQTTNPSVSTGDGVAMARRAGGILRDLEFIQFHPTALFKTGAPRFLISEAVRGEGAHLIDERGHRFAFEYHTDGELAPRDVVSRAIFSHLQKNGRDLSAGHVWLDLRPIPRERILHRFPNIIRVCQQWGIDILTEPIPVAPAAHYWMGGIHTDLTTATSMAGVYAVGETTSTGVHGANRLASNSLLECVVFGAGLQAIELPDLPPLASAPTVTIDPTAAISNLDTQMTAIDRLRQELPRIVWEAAGICRTQIPLERAIDAIERRQKEFNALPISQVISTLQPQQEIALPPTVKNWGETRNLLDIARSILRSALFRTESRGGHYRTDYPHPDPNWQLHTILQGDKIDRR